MAEQIALTKEELEEQAKTRASLRIMLSNASARRIKSEQSEKQARESRIKCEQEERRIKRALDKTPQSELLGETEPTEPPARQHPLMQRRPKAKADSRIVWHAEKHALDHDHGDAAERLERLTLENQSEKKKAPKAEEESVPKP